MTLHDFTFYLSTPRLSPILIGATGGSGTRLVQAILEHAGVFMGKNLNASRDCMDFAPFLEQHINTVMPITGGTDYRPAQLPAPLRRNMYAQLRRLVRDYRLQLTHTHQPWGWKNPRSIFMLPVLHGVCHKLRFIHVVRDGRDMAFSSNQNQRNKHYEAVFATPCHAAHTQGEEASIALWNRINTQTYRWGMRYLKNRYYTLRFEDLCATPEATIAALFDWLSITPTVPLGELATMVTPPQSIGRHRAANTRLCTQLENIAEEGLALFGYLPQAPCG